MAVDFPERRGLAIFGAGGSAGQVVAPQAVGAMAAAVAWETGFMALGLPVIGGDCVSSFHFAGIVRAVAQGQPAGLPAYRVILMSAREIRNSTPSFRASCLSSLLILTSHGGFMCVTITFGR